MNDASLTLYLPPLSLLGHLVSTSAQNKLKSSGGVRATLFSKSFSDKRGSNAAMEVTLAFTSGTILSTHLSHPCRS
jgi:hypothetical protein